MRLQPIASALQNFAQIPAGTPEEKIALAKRVPGRVRTSDSLLHSGLYPRLTLLSNISTDVTTPRTEPQKIFDRNMDAPFKKIEMSWATKRSKKLRLEVRPTTH
jgi:hypothetical protein